MVTTKNINSILMTATGQAHTGPGILKRVILSSAANGGTSAIVYDGTGTSGVKITPTLLVDPGIEAGEVTITKSLEIGSRFETGVHVVIAGTNPEVLIVIE